MLGSVLSFYYVLVIYNNHYRLKKLGQRRKLNHKIFLQFDWPNVSYICSVFDCMYLNKHD